MINNFRRSYLIPAIILFLSALLPAPQMTDRPKILPAGFDAKVKQIMETFRVPGLALAVVKDGRILLARGYGVKNISGQDKVDADTLFNIASNTKAFTATALAVLEEERKIRWDDPVIDYMPWFRMWDPYVTRELSVRDLLVHRSGLGLGAGDLLWWPPSTYNRREIVRRLRYIRPATSFRSAYAYDNILYLAAGELIEEISGLTWEEFIEERILKKTGMNRSLTGFPSKAGGINIAAPHALIDGEIKAIKPFQSRNTNPAGGICSSASDMAKWLNLLLNNGLLPDGSRLFSERSAGELTAPVTPIPSYPPPPELGELKTNFRAYALGFGIQDYRGKKMVSHTGGMPGYLSKVTLIPAIKLGIAVLTNQESAETFNALTYIISDHFLRAPPKDWAESFLKVRCRNEKTLIKIEEEASLKRNRDSKPSLPLSAYTGAYRDDWYGEIEINRPDDHLNITFSHTPALTGTLEHWQYDTFLVRWRDRELRADAYVTFSLNPDGTIESAKMMAASPRVDFSFDFHDLLLKPVLKK